MSFLFINKTLRFNNLKTRTAMNAKSQCLLFMLKWSYVCYYIICIAVSLMFSELYASIYFQDFVIICIIWLYVKSIWFGKLNSFLNSVHNFGLPSILGVRKNAPGKTPPRKLPPGNKPPKKIAPRKNAPQENCPPENCFPRFFLLLTLSYSSSFQTFDSS